MSNNHLSISKLEQLLKTLFSHIPNLRSLDLSGNSALWAEPQLIATMQNLKTLNLSETNITDIKTLASLTSLQELYLNGTKVTDVSTLASLTSLQTLNLSATYITDISALASLTSLKKLNVSRTKITDDGIRQLKQSHLCLHIMS